jgi:transcriptional regulator with XRE-family HTH domain
MQELPDPRRRREIRIALGLTQAQAAELVGTTQAQFSHAESGAREPTGALRENYAHTLSQFENIEARLRVLVFGDRAAASEAEVADDAVTA